MSRCLRARPRGVGANPGTSPGRRSFWPPPHRISSPARPFRSTAATPPAPEPFESLPLKDGFRAQPGGEIFAEFGQFRRNHHAAIPGLGVMGEVVLMIGLGW